MLKLFLLINLTILAISCGRVIREAPNTESAVQTPELSLQTVFSIAENGLLKLKEVILESFDATTTDDLQGKAKEQGETIINQVKTWAANIKKTTDEWQDNVSVKELHDIATSAIEGLKADHPKLTSEATGYIDYVTKTSEKIFEQIKAITQSDESKNIKELSEKLLETTKQSFILIGSKLEELDEHKGPKTE